jgi:hypothetical protein
MEAWRTLARRGSLWTLEERERRGSGVQHGVRGSVGCSDLGLRLAYSAAGVYSLGAVDWGL